MKYPRGLYGPGHRCMSRTLLSLVEGKVWSYENSHFPRQTISINTVLIHISVRLAVYTSNIMIRSTVILIPSSSTHRRTYDCFDTRKPVLGSGDVRHKGGTDHVQGFERPGTGVTPLPTEEWSPLPGSRCLGVCLTLDHWVVVFR